MKQAKVFFLICGGIMMLTVALKVGTEPAWADYDPGTPGPAIAMSGGRVLLENGESWWAWDPDSYVPGWTRVEDYDSPIPVSEIYFYDGEAILSTSGKLWIYYQPDWPDGEWMNMGVPPETPAAGTSWSRLKSQFGR